MSDSVSQAMKDSGLPTAETPELAHDFPFNTPIIKAIAAQEKEMLGFSGGGNKTHVVVAGGKRKYVVRIEARRKFINFGGGRVFLSEIRGKYSYV